MLQDHSADLPYLIGFRTAVVALQIDSLGNAILPEYMVASLHSLGEPQIPEQTTQVVEADAGVRATAEDPLQKLLVSAHA